MAKTKGKPKRKATGRNKIKKASPRLAGSSVTDDPGPRKKRGKP